MNRKLEDELIAELLSPAPKDYRPPASGRGHESEAVKRARLKQLDRELNTPPVRSSSTEAQMAALAGMRGRICDLPSSYLDLIAQKVPQTREIQAAQREINRMSNLGKANTP